MKLYEKFQQVAQELKLSVIEREHFVNDMMLAICVKEHMMLLGQPGTGKSLVSKFASMAFNYIGSDGSKPYFATQLNGYTEFDKVFGPRNLKAYVDEGKLITITKNYLPNARIVLIDEITRANKAISDSLLMALNERTFEQDGELVDIPLETALCTSNFKYSSVHFEALADRVLFWQDIRDVTDDSFSELIDGNFDGSCIKTTISEAELQQARAEIKDVVITDKTKEAFKAIKITLRDEPKIRISDRKVIKIAKVLKAVAWMHGRKYTLPEDCRAIINCIWNDPEQIKIVTEIVCKLVVPEAQILDALLSDATTMAINHKEQPSAYPVSDVTAKLLEIRTTLEEMEATIEPENKQLHATYLSRVKELQLPYAKKTMNQMTGRSL